MLEWHQLKMMSSIHLEMGLLASVLSVLKPMDTSTVVSNGLGTYPKSGEWDIMNWPFNWTVMVLGLGRGSEADYAFSGTDREEEKGSRNGASFLVAKGGGRNRERAGPPASWGLAGHLPCLIRLWLGCITPYPPGMGHWFVVTVAAACSPCGSGFCLVVVTTICFTQSKGTLCLGLTEPQVLISTLALFMVALKSHLPPMPISHACLPILWLLTRT